MLADARGDLHAVAASSEDAEMMELLQLQAEQARVWTASAAPHR
jgi:hypothetical protein